MNKQLITPKHNPFALSALALFLLTALPSAEAGDNFDLQGFGYGTPMENTSTLQNFIDNNALMPGTWSSVVMVGQEQVDKRSMTYLISADKQRLEPQITLADLRRYGVRTRAAPGLKALPDSTIIGNIASYIEGAAYNIDPGARTLTISIPQLYLDQASRDSISPDLWDDGVPAAWLSYDYHGGSQHTDDAENETSHYVNLNASMTAGPWRLFNNSTWSNTEGWDTLNTWLQRDIKPLQSQLFMGQTYTNGDIFDSISFTGVKLETDTDMLPYSLQGFAPTISGIASSDARVTVKQGGYTIYQTWVSAGPFELKDINQVTSGGDLEITVREADGSEHSWIQASSSVPMMLRQGALKFSLSGGNYRDSYDDGNAEEPTFAQGTIVYGLPYGMTIYGGEIVSDIYLSALLGMGFDLHQLGSFSVDVNGARSETIKNDAYSESGLSWRMQYAKNIQPTNTTLTLASYRYSTSGFYTFQEALDQRADHADDSDDLYSYRRMYNRRSRWQINLSQSMDRWGSLNISGSQQDYWDLDGHERTLSVGYSNTLGRVMYSMNYNQTSTPDSDTDKQLAFTVTVPLDAWMPNAYANYNMNNRRHGATNHQAGLSGTLLEDNSLNYSVMQGYQDSPFVYSGSTDLNYRSSFGEFGAGYSYDDNNRQYNYRARGSIVAHPHGVTLGQAINNSALAIVHTEGASGVQVQNGTGITTDMFGNAVVPSLQSYRSNSIRVNTSTAENVEISQSVLQRIPNDGAVVMADFNARVGTRVLVTLLHHGQPVPFGAVVNLTNTSDPQSSIVADAGEVYLSGINEASTLQAQWGQHTGESCLAKLPEVGNQTQIVQLTVTCQ